MKEYILNLIKKDKKNVTYYLEQLECQVDLSTRNEIFNKIKYELLKECDWDYIEILMNELNIKED